MFEQPAQPLRASLSENAATHDGGHRHPLWVGGLDLSPKHALNSVNPETETVKRTEEGARTHADAFPRLNTFLRECLEHAE